MRFTRYLTRAILHDFILVLPALLGFFMVVDGASNFKSVFIEPKNWSAVMTNLALRVPAQFYLLLPTAALVSTLSALSRLARDFEYTAMRIAGLTQAHFFRMLLVPGLLFALLTLLTGDWLVPTAAEGLRRRHSKTLPQLTSGLIHHNLWVRDQNRIIRITAVTATQSLRDLHIYTLKQPGRFQSIWSAKQAHFLGNGSWKLLNVQQATFHQDRVVKQPQDALIWHSTLTPRLISSLLTKPEQMPSGQLWQYIRYLRANAQDAKRALVFFWNKVAYVLNACILVFVALPFVSSQPRTLKPRLLLLAGLFSGLLLILLNALILQITLAYPIPPIAAAILPLLIVLTAGLGAFWWQNRRS